MDGGRRYEAALELAIARSNEPERRLASYSSGDNSNDARRRAAKAQAEVKRLESIIAEIRAWIVCAAIASPADMAENFPRIIEITEPSYAGKGGM